MIHKGIAITPAERALLLVETLEALLVEMETLHKKRRIQ